MDEEIIDLSEYLFHLNITDNVCNKTEVELPQYRIQH